MTTAYDIGDAPRLSISFTDYADVSADPTAVTFAMTEPDGSVVQYDYLTNAELVKDSVGNYHVDYLLSKSGRHTFKFTGTGAVNSAESADLYVRAS